MKYILVFMTLITLPFALWSQNIPEKIIYEKNPIRYLLIIILLISLTTCGKKENKTSTHKAVVIYTFGDVKILPDGANPKPVEIKEIVKVGDIIKTGKQSQLTLQIGNTTIVKLQPQSVIKASSLFKSEGNILFLEKGQVLSKVRRLKKDTIYKVRTPTAVASVRGTEFSVSYVPGESRVAVKKGKVHIERTDEAAKKTHEKSLNEGFTAIIKDDIKTRPMNNIESLEIEIISINEIIGDIDKMSKPQLKKTGDRLKPREDEIDKKIKNLKPPGSLSEIKARYNRVDSVILFSGKTYRGIILSRGKTYKVLTPNGVIWIPSKKIKRTSVIR